MQQLCNFRYVGHVRGGVMNEIHQTRFSIRADRFLRPEIVILAVLRLMHFLIALAFHILGRAERIDIAASTITP